MSDTAQTTTPPSSLYTFDAATGTFASGSSESGEFVEDTDLIKARVENVLSEVFGTDPSNPPDPSTPLGRLVEWLALDFATSMRVNVQNANQLVIGSAAGQQLDAIALLFGLVRLAAAPTSVVATLYGAQGAVVPAGSRARTQAGDVFELASNVTLSTPEVVGGETLYTGSGTFTCTATGPVPVLAGELNTIDTAALGWISVVNPADGTLGRDTETDDALRSRVEASRFHSIGFIGSMKNAIEAVPGVTSSMIVENNTGGVLTVHGIDNMPAHSIYVCVACPASALTAVADAVLRTKPCGTGYMTSGVTPVVATDDYGNHYYVFIHTPTPYPVKVSVQVRRRSYAGIDLAADVKSAVVAWASERSYAIGETVYAADIARAVESRVPGVLVLACGVTDGGISQAAPYQEIAASAQASFAAADIAVAEV